MITLADIRTAVHDYAAAERHWVITGTGAQASEYAGERLMALVQQYGAECAARARGGAPLQVGPPEPLIIRNGDGGSR